MLRGGATVTAKSVALLACAWVAVGCGDGRRLVPGSTCEDDSDCDAYTSCAWRVDACECRSSVCYLDPDAPFDEELGCRGCHGSLENAAPPRSTTGATATTDLAVGAHQAHMRDGEVSMFLGCDECHAVPTRVNEEGHIDGSTPAEVVFGTLATANGAVAARWDRESGTCVTYCHGATLSGGSNTTPSWTKVDGSQAACGTCHGTPPTENHPADERCELCHDPTAGSNRTVADRTTHIDGALQLTGGRCDACHGDSSRPAPLNAAPPTDLEGNEASAEVGAHLIHLTAAIGADVPCTSCHVVPTSYGDPGHVDDDDATAELTFAGRAVATEAGAPTPTYDLGAKRCTDTYCHGVTLAGGNSDNQVEWTGGAAESQCDACHGLPPATPGHESANVQSTTPCGDCHPDSASAVEPATITVRQFHIDGTLQVAGCGSACHDVPPDTGAHAMHAGTLGFECAACHGHNGSGPTHNEDTSDPPVVRRENVDIVFADRSFVGGTSIGNGVGASYDPVTMTCRVGCHNPVPGNPDETPNLDNRPTWVAGALECRACHDEIGASPPMSHAIGTPDRTDCSYCHDLAQHTQGAVMLVDQDPADAFVPTPGDIEPLCKGCHDGGGGTYFGGATPRNVLQAWNASAHGQDGMACSDCHTYHVSTTNTSETFVQGGVNGCIESGCHADLVSSPSGAFTFSNSHHSLGEDAADALRCTDCHNPHLAKESPNAASDPDDKWTLVSYPTIAASQTRSNGVETRGFCLACHDGSPPPGVSTSAMNIQQALSGGSEPSAFKKESESLHRKAHSRFNCVTCHDWHGSPGTQGINRGRTLQPFITVQSFPYNEEHSCGTPSNSSGNLGRFINGTWVNYSLGCHD